MALAQVQPEILTAFLHTFYVIFATKWKKRKGKKKKKSFMLDSVGGNTAA